jgi:hypothetical protein
MAWGLIKHKDNFTFTPLFIFIFFFYIFFTFSFRPPYLLLFSSAITIRNSYCSPSIIRISKSRRIRWAGHVARIGGEEECIEDIAGKARRKETVGKTKA